MNQLNDTQKRVAQRILKVSSAGLAAPIACCCAARCLPSAISA
jgi:hypothetical protein